MSYKPDYSLKTQPQVTSQATSPKKKQDPKQTEITKVATRALSPKRGNKFHNTEVLVNLFLKLSSDHGVPLSNLIGEITGVPPGKLKSLKNCNLNDKRLPSTDENYKWDWDKGARRNTNKNTLQCRVQNGRGF
jgi:hypothetical protein